MDAPAQGRRDTAGRARPLRSLRATVALKAGRGVSKASRRARPRAERWRLALDCGVDSGFESRAHGHHRVTGAACCLVGQKQQIIAFWEQTGRTFSASASKS